MWYSKSHPDNGEGRNTVADVQLVARNEVTAENSCIPPMTVSSDAAGIVARRLRFDWEAGRKG